MVPDTLQLNDKCLLTELADGTGVILDLDTKFYYTLNTTGVEVWKAIRSGICHPPEIAGYIATEFDIDRHTAESDLAAILRILLDEGLVRRAER
jgi:hypothetical protein